jgi:histidyl-tRNA synthetase
MAPQFTAPKGMLDVLAPESSRWVTLVASFAEHFGRAGFALALTPLIEHVEVFQRVGASTDVVRKEMYDFLDKGERPMAVRPEITASLMRAFAEHRPTTPWKVWTFGPNFRYESPQSGRYRQHYQLDAETVGTDDPDSDAEIIALLDGFYRSLGLRNYTLALTSLGDADCRPQYLTLLRAHFEANRDALSEQSRQTMELNPLRVLDSKREQDADIIAAAPTLLDHLSEPSARHFDHVQRALRSVGVTYQIAPRLVRGLDYYTRTTFEFSSHAMAGAQNAIGGGGRYDGLVEQLGGPPGTSGIGFGSGVERLLLACDAEAALGPTSASVQVFIVDTTGDHALTVSHELRSAGISTDRSFDGRSMKSQMKAADRSGARMAVLIGSDEAHRGTVTVRSLRGERDTGTDIKTGAPAPPQREIARDQLVVELRKLLS